MASRLSTPIQFPARATPAAKGFSLIELLVAVIVFGLLVLFAPSVYRDWIAAQQLAHHTHFLVDRLNQARSESIKSGYRVNLCKSRDRRQCSDTGGWEAGWIMFVDENQNGELDPDEPIIFADGPSADGVTISGNRPVADYVSYTSLGHARLLTGALQMGTFVVCKPGQAALHVVLANSGRVRIENTTDRCQ